MFDKPHPGTATKKCSNWSLKSLELPKKICGSPHLCWVFFNIPGTTVTLQN